MAIKHYFLSIDIGTHSFKYALFDHNKLCLSYKSLIFNKKEPVIPNKWEKCLLHCTETCSYLENTALYISISGHGPSIVCLDKNEKIIDYVSWNTKHAEYIQGLHSYFLPQLAYIRTHKPSLYKKISCVLPPAEYLAFLLSGIKSAWVPHKAFASYVWTAKEIKSYNFPHRLFPKITLSARILGKARGRLADIFLQYYNNVYIVSGGLDYMSALLGSNCYSPKTICIRSGTSVVLNTTVKGSIQKEISPDKTLFPEFTLMHFFPEYTHKGITLPHYTKLYVAMKSLWTEQEQYSFTKILKILSKVNVSYVEKHLKPLITRSRPITSIRLALTKHKIVGSQNHAAHIMVLLALIFIEALSHITACDKKKSFTVGISGGMAKDKVFTKALSHLICHPIHIHVPQHCELIGNLAFSLVASKESVNIRSALKKIAKIYPSIFL